MSLNIVMTPASRGGLYGRLELAVGPDHWCATRWAPPGEEMGLIDDLARAMVGFNEAGALGAVSVLAGRWVF